MKRKIYAIYRDGTIKEINTPKMKLSKVESAYDITKWIADHEAELKTDANNLHNWGEPCIGFNLLGVISDSIRKRIVRTDEKL
ncbi:hypothetical protein LCGC14_0351530 [marine sediment metagenome]|uniref:Uncharacterized protein n=1 Tax=marine sediment metagenome TaxID=412755 RepID=A0A0F9TGA7_9ZZZZ